MKRLFLAGIWLMAGSFSAHATPVLDASFLPSSPILAVLQVTGANPPFSGAVSLGTLFRAGRSGIITVVAIEIGKYPALGTNYGNLTVSIHSGFPGFVSSTALASVTVDANTLPDWAVDSRAPSPLTNFAFNLPVAAFDYLVIVASSDGTGLLNWDAAIIPSASSAYLKSGGGETFFFPIDDYSLGFAVYVDDAVVDAVEPASLTLLGVGIVVTGLARRRGRSLGGM